VLFTVATSDILSFDDARIAVRSLKTGEQRELVRGGTWASLGPSGELLYARAGALFAVPFDAKRLVITGRARPVVDGVVTSPINGAALYAVSQNGTLLYIAGKPDDGIMSKLVWLDRGGRVTPLSIAPAPFNQVSIAPDGQRAALDIDGANANIWILDLNRNTMTRLTTAWSNNGGVWTPDGTRVVFSSSRAGAPSLFWQQIDGQLGAELLVPGSLGAVLGGLSWVPDGKTMVFSATIPHNGYDLFVMRVGADHTPKPLMQTPFNERGPAVSPDGQWLAYVSDETGRNEVYLQAYPSLGRKTRVSTDGGTSPHWSRNGRELFYRNGDAMMSVAITMSPSVIVSRPELLFRKPASGLDSFAVSADGRFLMLEDIADENSTRPVSVVLNWQEELKQSLPTR
jgi:dipeptidyl aminopeptidase/acylaminoacyl peptidase